MGAKDQTLAARLRHLQHKHRIPDADMPLYARGCSGGVTWAYRKLLGQDPSYNGCCKLHDLLYYLGPDEGERKDADRELLACCLISGTPGGCPGKAWRWLRAWIIYAFVRAFGGKYWKDEGLFYTDLWKSEKNNGIA